VSHYGGLTEDVLLYPKPVEADERVSNVLGAPDPDSDAAVVDDNDID